MTLDQIVGLAAIAVASITIGRVLFKVFRKLDDILDSADVAREHSGRLTAIESRMGSVEGQLDTIESKLDTVVVQTNGHDG